MWRIFWAFVLIVIGVVFLLINLGILPGDAWNYLFPALLILLGIFLLIGWHGGSEQTTAHEVIPLDDAARGEITLKHGAGLLNVHGGADPTVLLDGTFHGGVEKKLDRVQDLALVEFKTPSNAWENLGFSNKRGLEWQLALNPNIPLTLRYEGGAAETRMDLSGVRLVQLAVNTGASSTDVVLPYPSGTMRVSVNSGAATVKLRLPREAAASIRGKMDLGSMNVDLARFPNRGFGIHQSENYAAATDRIELTIEGGVGSVEIR